MIPRYRPTFTGADIGRAAALARGDAANRLSAELAGLVGMPHVFLLDSARSALVVALRALGANRSVLVPAYTCSAVPAAAVAAGWRPVFVDINEQTLNVSPPTLCDALAGNTVPGAAILTHQFGVPCEIEQQVAACRQQGVVAIEDAAPALGATYHGRAVGSFGDMTVLSFHPAKVLSAGRLGALLVRDGAVAERIAAAVGELPRGESDVAAAVRALTWLAATSPGVAPVARRLREALRRRDNGDPAAAHVLPGLAPPACPSRFVVALAGLQMAKLPANLEARRAVAGRYADALAGGPLAAQRPAGCEGQPAWTQYTVVARDRAAARAAAWRHGVDAAPNFDYACSAILGDRGCAVAERVAGRCVAFPVYPRMTPRAVQCVTSVLAAMD